MGSLIKNNTVLESDEVTFLTLQEYLDSDNRPQAVWLDAGEEIEAIADFLDDITAIALNFPAFSDGRAYSTAAVLRRHHNYTGEIRAIGDVRLDQLEQMARCGFNADQLADGQNADQALKRIEGFSVSYQQTIDRDPCLDIAHKQGKHHALAMTRALMGSDPFIFSFFLIFACAGILATLALFTRQPLIVVYIITGMILGPSGVAFIDNPQLISSTAKFGIIFLLFLLGLDMQPAKLINTLRSSMLVGLSSCVIFFIAGASIAFAFGYTQTETVIIGVAMMFSSTIIGIKLLPTTVLHHRRTGELIISQLLIQDLVAIIVLLVVAGGFLEFSGASKIVRVLVSLPLLILGAWVFVKYVMLPLLEKFDAFHEYIFLIAIGWCLGLAEMAELLGLSLEIGAFVAGVTIATSPIALYIADHLKPLRDFFLILFFFSIGAGFHMALLADVILPALFLAGAMLALKPVVFRFLLRG